MGIHQEQPGTGLADRLRAALTVAMSSRDTVAVAAIRSALAAIGNAEAVPPPARLPGSAGGRRVAGSEHVAGAFAGLGAAEAARKPLTPAEISQIVAAEIAGRQTAANQYDALGRASQADRLRREAAALTAIAQPPG